MTANIGGMMKKKQLNLTDIKENNPYQMKVFLYRKEKKEQIRVFSEHPNFEFDVYHNINKKTPQNKWVYGYTGSTGLVNDYDNNS